MTLLKSEFERLKIHLNDQKLNRMLILWKRVLQVKIGMTHLKNILLQKWIRTNEN